MPRTEPHEPPHLAGMLVPSEFFAFTICRPVSEATGLRQTPYDEPKSPPSPQAVDSWQVSSTIKETVVLSNVIAVAASLTAIGKLWLLLVVIKIYIAGRDRITRTVK